jgi:hypothetical protein
VALSSERNEVQLTSPNGITPGGTATFSIPRGFKVHHLRIQYGGSLADYNEVRVIANTETVRRCSFTEQDMMNQSDKLPDAATAGYLLIPFDKIFERSRDSEEETALNVGSPPEAENVPDDEITSAEVQVDIASGASSPALKIFATVSNVDASGAGLVRHIVKTARNAGGAGELDIQDLDYGTPNRAFIRRVFMKTEALDNITIKRDDRIIFDRPWALNNTILEEAGYRARPSGWTIIDKSEYGYGGLRIDTRGAQSLRFQLTFNAAEPSFPILTEYVGRLKA